MDDQNQIIDFYKKKMQSLIDSGELDRLQKQAKILMESVNVKLYRDQIENALKILKSQKTKEYYLNNVININSLRIANRIIKRSDQDSDFSIQRINDYAILNNLVENIGSEETDQFYNYISTNPFLSYKHETGKKIYVAVKNSVKNIYPKDNVLFRVRVPKTKSIPYSYREMFSPQYGESIHGRFSFVGINYLYFSESLQDSLLETKADISKKYTYIKVKNKKQFMVLDITNLKIPLFNRCHINVSEDMANLKTEYLIPNYIANCAYDNTFDGIIYNSVSGQGKNIVLFGSGYSDFIEIETKGENY